MDFVLAKEEDSAEIMALYRSVLGSEGCTWSLDYPNEEILQDDLVREALFVLKKDEKEIVGAISIDDDKIVDELACWSEKLQPGAELARLVVKEAYQNQGIARILIQSMEKILRKEGYRSVHFLVSKTNERALRSYAKLNFTNKGDADLFGQHWWCYEKEL